MALSKKFSVQLIASLVLVGAVFLTLYLTDSDRELYLTAGWLVITLALVWVSNHFLTRRLDKKLPWLEHGNKRFYWQLGIGILMSLLIINLSYFILKLGLTSDPPNVTQVLSMNVYGILILLPTISINFGIQFLSNWKTAQVNSETFQKETIRAELTTLKNHLDPHFLFNNLNILSSLISVDTELSQTYLEKFADVYRNILKSSKEELVTLNDELRFIASYLYLLEIRFEDTIQTFIDIDSKAHMKYLPPLTLQMLIENAIKHNVISEIRPLKIHISYQNGYVSVKNPLQEKRVEKRNSGKTGLTNIQKRYSYFTDKEVQVFKNPDNFIVKIPLIDLESE
ncbi:sensor histidine kinase [Roseivirga sp. 4D4]|uniref:sensor histidine kinase n=1 Tax=Roseivirga sp. 4D4 TaxID=1889784 RepID=UPI0009F438AC|nr:histidine kinase [Roseivirga sp. 4D4]